MMGIFLSCCKPSAKDVLTPDPETRRRQLQDAAERRRQADAARGVRDPDRVRRQQQRADDHERRERDMQAQGGAGAVLKWTAD